MKLVNITVAWAVDRELMMHVSAGGTVHGMNLKALSTVLTAGRLRKDLVFDVELQVLAVRRPSWICRSIVEMVIGVPACMVNKLMYIPKFSLHPATHPLFGKPFLKPVLLGSGRRVLRMRTTCILALFSRRLFCSKGVGQEVSG